MPISTLCTKSMPSTRSRKPCTKCWRACSPSVTMSMPASSWALRARSVASRLATSRSAPAWRQGAHSVFGSASQNGFGRLPAIVVGNMYHLLDRAVPSRSPGVTSIEPIITPEQGLAAFLAQRPVSEERHWSLEVVKSSVPARCPLHAGGAAGALTLIGTQRLVRSLRRAAELFRQHISVLDRHGGALRQERQHRMRSVAQKRDRTVAPAAQARAVVQRPLQPAVGQGE